MKYLAYYDIPNNSEEKRNAVLAAINKVNYICSAINRAGIPVEIISASAPGNRGGSKGKVYQVLPKTTAKLFPGMGTGGLLKRVVSRAIFKTCFFLYMLLHTKKNEKVLVYHGMGYASMIMLLKKLKKFHLILEVEEIYADVSGDVKEKEKEFRLFKMADAYIFPAQRMNTLINTEGKPYALICGTYQAEQDKNTPPSDGKIHCVYAGTFDPRKGGGQAAVEAARHLPAGYHIHLLGFGPKKEMAEMEEAVARINQTGKCSISYDGLLQGEEYIRFLQGCHIGLSTQNPNAAFNDTSFPSKILSYMANGLQVVTPRIPVVVESPVDPYMHYYAAQEPEQIAKAIMTVKQEKNTKTVLQALDQQFMADIKALLEAV